MSEPKSKEVISDVIEVTPTDTPFVVAGYGETAKREGARLKEVFNVSFHEEPNPKCIQRS